MTPLSATTIASVAFCCSVGVLPASADPVPLRGGELNATFSTLYESGVDEFRLVSNGWAISSIAHGASSWFRWDNFCTGCGSDSVPAGAVIGGVVSWIQVEFGGVEAKGTVYGVEFPPYSSSNEDEYGTLWLLPRLTLTLDPFVIPQNHTGYPDNLRTTFKVSGELEGRDLRTNRSLVFRDAVSGRGTATFAFTREFDFWESASGLGANMNFVFEPTDSAPVPEPTSILLLATGFAVVGRRAWKRRGSGSGAP